MMNKKKTTVNKAVVRNTERPKPKTRFVNHYLNPQQEGSKSQKPNASEKPANREESKIRFKSPEPNSALVLARKIESLENLKPRKVKSVSSLPENQLALEEKVTKCMNFPVDHPIYKNLIPLCTKIVSQQSIPPSRPPLPNKDEEPSLSDFYKPKRNSEYSYQPSISNRQTSMVRDSDCLKLYRIMQTWNGP